MSAVAPSGPEKEPTTTAVSAPAEEKPAVAAKPHRLDTVSKFWVAIIALAATLTGAFFAARATISAAELNATTQTHVAQDNFLRNQRQVAYVDYLQSISDTESHIEAIDSALFIFPTTLEDLDNKLAGYNEAAAVENRNYVAVTLIGTDDVVQLADEVFSRRSTVTAKLNRAREQVPGDGQHADISDEERTNFLLFRDEFAIKTQELEHLMRQDLTNS